MKHETTLALSYPTAFFASSILLITKALVPIFSRRKGAALHASSRRRTKIPQTSWNHSNRFSKLHPQIIPALTRRATSTSKACMQRRNQQDLDPCS